MNLAQLDPGSLSPLLIRLWARVCWWSSGEVFAGAAGGCSGAGGGCGGLAFLLILRNEGSRTGGVGELLGLLTLSEIPRFWVMA